MAQEAGGLTAVCHGAVKQPTGRRSAFDPLAKHLLGLS